MPFSALHTGGTGTLPEYDKRLPTLCDSTLPAQPKAGTIPFDMTVFLAALLIGMLLP
jgi:hypothetical protein